LKILKGSSEVVFRKKPDDKTIAKGKGQTIIYKPLDRKLQIEQHEPHRGCTRVLRKSG